MVTEMFEYMRILIVEPSGGAATSMSLGNVKIDYTGFQNLLSVSNSE